MRLPGNLYLTLRKRGACHAIQTLRNLRVAIAVGRALDPCARQVSRQRWMDIDADLPKAAEVTLFRDYIPPPPPTLACFHSFFILSARKLSAYVFFSHALSDLLILSTYASYLSISFCTAEVPSKLPFISNTVYLINIACSYLLLYRFALPNSARGYLI